MVSKIVVGAHYGLKDWLLQRFTAVYMAAFSLVFAALLASRWPLDQQAWRALMEGGVMRFFAFIFILCLMVHAWVGVRDTWMDYVRPTGLTLAMHVLTALALTGYAGWALSILWRL
ncbi:MAG TPA: succinate dehydrogenase, hydrophobic membrane anchor protein [Candidatus Desulfobacillus sp.]|nr:succinate dehydrogenase, hydrophobic membrane anchor protein [Candidatus Desulfobacillus sp.]